FCGVYGTVMRMAQESGAGDEDYVQKAMLHYEHETRVPFRYRHCWDVLKDSPKFQEIAFPNFNQRYEGSSKRHKSSGSSSLVRSTQSLGTLVDGKRDDGKVEQRDAFMELKRREVECREREVAATEYRAQQEDIKLYLSPYDHLTGAQRLAMDEIKAKIKAKYNLQY
nr:hypothetical protein [Tanacetum cinerariifolium]